MQEFFPTGRPRPREMLVYVVHTRLKLDSRVTNPAGVTGMSPLQTLDWAGQGVSFDSKCCLHPKSSVNHVKQPSPGAGERLSSGSLEVGLQNSGGGWSLWRAQSWEQATLGISGTYCPNGSDNCHCHQE